MATGSQGSAVVFAHLRARAAELASLAPSDIQAMRTIIDRLAIDARPIDHVRFIRSTAPAGVWVVPQFADPDRRIVYCHGCSFMAGSIDLYAGLLSRLAIAARASLFFVDYRLAPEHTFPAAHDDCYAAFRWAREHGPHGAQPASACFLVGDSAGAGSALNAALAAARDGSKADAVVALSPFVDMTLSSESCTRNNGRDPVTTYEAAQACVSTYAPGRDPRDIRLSPLFADLSLLGPIQVHGSSLDSLLDDALRLADRARRAGVETELHVWGNVPHCWYLFANELPEAAAGIELAGRFLLGIR